MNQKGIYSMKKKGGNCLEIQIFCSETPCILVYKTKDFSKKPAACVLNVEHVKIKGSKFSQ